MELTRRQTLALGVATGMTLVLPLPALAAVEEVGSIDDFTGGATPSDSGVTVTAPEIAENGNTVPIAVDAPGAVEIRVYATGNPLPGIATFRFGPLAGSQSASTRVRLSGTQDVVAIAKMADGSFAQASKTVKVTIGGCGG